MAACSTFSYSLRLAMSAIRSGEAKAAVIGATDPPPHPLSVGTFYNARVLAADRDFVAALVGMNAMLQWLASELLPSESAYTAESLSELRQRSATW